MSSSTRIDELWKKFEENPRRFFAPLANEHRKAGDLEQAIAICRQHLPDQPGHISGHIVLAQALFEKSDLPEASDAFQAALALDPENLIALRSMGDIARLVGDPETARLWYERVLDVDPRNDEINTMIRELDATPEAGHTETAQWSNDDRHEPAEADTAESSEVAPLLDFEPTGQGDDNWNADQPVDVGVDVSANANADAVIDAPLFEMAGDPDAPDSMDLEIETATEPAGADASEPIAASGHSVAPEFEAWGFDEPDAEPPAAAESDDATAAFAWPDATEPAPGADEPAAASVDGEESWFESHEMQPPSTAASPAPVDGIESTEFTGGADAAAGAEIDGFVVEERPGFHLTPTDGSAVIEDEPAIKASDDALAAVSVDEPAVPSSDAAPFSSSSPTPPSGAAVPVRPTPSAQIDRVVPASTGFVTETMAELYLQQGYRDEALAVYRELLAQHPGDVALRERIAHLEAGEASSVAIESLSEPRVAGPSARSFFAGLARRSAPARSHAPPPLQPRRATPTVLTSLPPSALGIRAVDAGAADEAARGSLDALFGRTPVDDGERQAAERLASAFEAGESVAEHPTRIASSELSLDNVFGGTPPSVPATNGGSDFSFDQFFATPESGDAAAPASASVPPGDRSNDIEQFTAWLEGLKRK